MLLNAKGIPGCVIGKNGIFDVDSCVVRRNTSANPAGVIIGDRAIDDRRWRPIDNYSTADIPKAIRSSSRHPIARKCAVSNRGRRIFDPDTAALTGCFIISKCGVRDRKSLISAIVHLHQTAANSAVSSIGKG